MNTGATYSVLTSFSTPLTSRACTVLGLTGKLTSLPFTPPLCCLWEGSTFPHSFLAMPECPSLLLGQNILQNLGTRITLGESPSHQTPQQMLVLTDKDLPGQSPETWENAINPNV